MSEDIKVGDWVRWERVGRADLWAEGEVLSLTESGDALAMRVSSAGDHLASMRQGGDHQFDGPKWKSVSLRRIPRPCSDFIVKRTLDGDAVIEAVYRDPHPLEVMYDGVTLRVLVAQDRCNSQEAGPPLFTLKPAQRAAVSAHWSAELRAKVAAAKERERCKVSYSEWESGE